MGQLSSTLFTGLSGLVVNQTELNVVGNNIANANTTAFKSSRVIFTPQFYVTDSQGSPSTSTFGGNNPSQVGLGAQVSSVQTNFSAGGLQATGVSSDLAVDGNGFFIVKNSTAGPLYTRAGNFTLNDQQQLVDSDGNFVQGYGVDSNFNVVAGALQNLTIPIGQQTVAKATANAALTGDLNAGGVVATTASTVTLSGSSASTGLQDGSTSPAGAVTGTSLLVDLQDFGGTTNLYTSGQTITVTGAQDTRALPSQTFQVTATSTVAQLQTFLTGALGVDPNATIPTGTPAPGASIGTAAGGGQTLVITGNLGSENDISISGLADSGGVSPLTITNSASTTGESYNTSILAYDSLGNPVTLNVNTTLTGQSGSGGTNWNFTVTSADNEGGSLALGSGTLTFDSSGVLSAVTGNTVTLNRTGTGATPAQPITLDFSGVESITSSGSTVVPGLVNPSQDGYGIGTLNSYSVGTNGLITGSFSNGLKETLGQVALANFNNPGGLVNNGGNLYSAGANSGAAIVATPGSQGTGQILSGELEQSNVDLSQEFINLIIASTGYSASSRVISTSDQLLTELLNSH